MEIILSISSLVGLGLITGTLVGIMADRERCSLRTETRRLKFYHEAQRGIKRPDFRRTASRNQ